MKRERNNCLFRFIMILLTAGLIAFAFIHSSMNADKSGAESEVTMGFLQNFFDALNIKVEFTDYIVRKLAHFAEYTAIGIMLMNTAYAFNKSRPYVFYPHILFAGLFTAVIDEAIQIYVPGRAGLITDVLLDFSGVVIGTVAMLIILTIYKAVCRKRR